MSIWNQNFKKVDMFISLKSILINIKSRCPNAIEWQSHRMRTGIFYTTIYINTYRIFTILVTKESAWKALFNGTKIIQIGPVLPMLWTNKVNPLVPIFTVLHLANRRKSGTAQYTDVEFFVSSNDKKP